MGQELTAAEAAARLGVKRATLYAYVSRGLLHRHLAMDGRTSLFDADEVDSFRTRRRRQTEGELDTVISTALTRVDDTGLRIRGRDLVGMVDDGLSYEEVVDWLWNGSGEPWHLAAELEASVAATQTVLPPAAPLLDRLRVTTAVLSASDPLRFDLGPPAVRGAGRSLLTAMVVGLPLLGRPGAGDRLADQLWPRLTERRGLVDRRHALNAALALLADHGLAASTFGARIAASTRADPYSIVSAGLGVVGGTLHGAASGAVHRLFAEAERLEDPARAVGESHRRGGPVPGFGHSVYQHEDPRYGALMRRVSDAWRHDPRLATVQSVRELISRRTDAIPNIDLALGSLTWLSDMTEGAGEAIFSVSRTAGWLAHGLEEMDEQPLRFRPRARYTGERGFTPEPGSSLDRHPS